MTDTDHAKTERENALKKQIDADRAAREKAQADRAKTMADTKPTPTQAENDQAACGIHLAEHEADGSPPDPNITPLDPKHPAHRQAEAKPGAGAPYSTRTAAPKP